MLKIAIADDHAIVRRGIRNIVEDHHGWEVCGEAADGPSALDLAFQQRPHVLVLDVCLPLMNGIAVTRQLRQEAPQTNVLLFTMCDDHKTVSESLLAGARGYLLKTDVGHHLEAAISALGSDRPYFSPVVNELLLDTAVHDRRKRRAESFTDRELEVALLVSEGNSNKQIAQLLSLSIKTIESHRGSAMRKAGVRTAADFVRFAIRQNLFQA
jgi:DNA-binding NarL/FixJ family response regulator